MWAFFHMLGFFLLIMIVMFGFVFLSIHFLPLLESLHINIELVSGVFFFGIVLSVGWFIFLRYKKYTTAWEIFAKSHNYTNETFLKPADGSIFLQNLEHKEFLHHVSKKVKNFSIQLYNLVGYNINSEKDITQLVEITVAEITGSHNFPHIFLRPANHHSTSVLWHPDFSSFERLSLEGNFDDFFSVYSEKYLNSDALVFLTPDVMEKLIKLKPQFDIEIAPGKIFILSDQLAGNIDTLNALDELANDLIDIIKNNS